MAAVQIYRVTCIVNGRSYIGMTCSGITKRWRGHVRDALVRRYHSFLHRAIRRYGADAFTIVVCASAPTRDAAAAIERAMIVSEGTQAPIGYNMTAGGDGGATRNGYRHTQAARQKISKGNAGKVRSPECVEEMRRRSTGRTLSPAHAEQLRLGAKKNRGRKHTEADRMEAHIRRRQEALARGDRSGIERYRDRWAARIIRDGKRKWLGNFQTIEEAHAAYRAAAEEHLAELLARRAAMQQNYITEPSPQDIGAQDW